MTAENGFPEGYSPGETNNPDEDTVEKSTETQIQLYKAGFNATGTWLYELAFSSINEIAAAEDQAANQTEKNSADDKDGDMSQALTLTPPGQQAKQMAQLIKTLFRMPTNPCMALNELLSEWTSLTEDVIEGVKNPEKDDKVKSKGKNDSDEPDDLPVIRFKDAVGRKFGFPFALAKTWAAPPRPRHPPRHKVPSSPEKPGSAPSPSPTFPSYGDTASHSSTRGSTNKIPPPAQQGRRGRPLLPLLCFQVLSIEL